jgi:predicted nucleic acid-binding protein
MSVDATTLLFFDASCLIAAAGSPMGGSGFLLSLCARQLLRGAVSQAVLLEAERNIQAKLGEQVLGHYHGLLQRTPLSLAPIPRISPQTSWLRTVNVKDVHVVAAALAVRAAYLLTLDRRLAVQVNEAGLSLQALAPGEFIKTVLPHHTSYPSLRQ